MRNLILAACLLACIAPAARAGAMNLAVGPGCWSENPVATMAWPCSTNTVLAMQLTASFQLYADMPEAIGSETVIDGQSDVPNLPDWWNPTCRTVVWADIAGFPGVDCMDVWGGAAFGGAVVNVILRNRIRILVGYALPIGSPIHIPAGQEFCNCHVNIGGTKAVGVGNCAGCTDAFTLVLNEITLHGVGGVRESCVSVINNHCISWQDGWYSCYGSPARNATWGQVKGLYR